MTPRPQPGASGASGRYHPEGWSGPDAPFAPDPAFQRPPERGEQIRQVVDLLLRGKWIILGCLLLVAVPVAIYTYTLPNQYRAYTLLRVEPEQGSSLGDLFSSRSLFSGTQNDRFLSNELLVLRQSLLLAERTAEELIDLGRDPESGAPLTILTNAEGRALPLRAVALRLQGGYVSAAAEGRDVDAIRISATSTVPQEAALIANMYAQEYMERARESSRASVSASREFLESQVDKRAEELQSLDNDVEEFMRREGAVALDEESSFLVSQVSELEALRDETQIDLQLRQATVDALRDELNAIRPNLADRLASGIDREIEAALEKKAELEIAIEQIYLRNPALRTEPATGELATLQAQLTDVRRRLRDLAGEYVDESLGVGGASATDQALAQVADLQRQVVEGRIEINGLEARLDVLDARIAEYERQINRIPGQAIELAQMQRARASAEQTYAMLVSRLQEFRVAEESELGYAELIRPALIPWGAFSPDRQRNVLMGVLLGLGLGIALAFAKIRLDNRVHRPDDLRDMGFTVIGVIPDMSKHVKKDFDGKEVVELDGQRFDTRLISVLNPLATVSEAYRGLRTNVQFSRPDVVIQTILVTSPSPTEGKSVTAANLAAVFAQTGRRVLLIDADLRRPTVHKKLGLKKEPGLREILFQEQAFDPDNYATVVDDLYVVPAGSNTHNPSELIGSKRMRDTIEVFREAFDVVIFDAPPVLAATDAVLLSTQCDATVLVTAAGKTKTYETEYAMDALYGVGAQVIGTILNGFDASKAYGYSYKYRYGYANYYGHGYAPSASASSTS